MKSDTAVFSNAHILVIGDVMLDQYIWGDVQRISPEAPVPVVRIKNTTETLGGAGNVAANIKGLGADVTVLGVVGKDATGKQLKKIFNEKQIRIRLTEDMDRPTITKRRIMSQGQQLIRLDEERPKPLKPVNETSLMKYFTQALPDCQAVILSDYGKGIFQTPGICKRIIEKCQQRNIPVLVDPKGGQWDRYKGATCVTPNTKELSQVVTANAIDDDAGLVYEAKRFCREHQFDWLLVTRGARGMCLVDGGNIAEFIRAKARDVFDVSGAGDTVIAVMAVCLACGHPMLSAANTANLAAGVVVEKLGTHPIDLAALETAARLMAYSPEVSHPSKLVTLEAAIIQVSAWRSANERIVFTNGCFDLLHPGHITLLQQARAIGNRLVVGLNTDDSVRRLKGESRPILKERDRAAILGALTSVDLVVLFDEDTPLNLIQVLMPDFLVKGADYKIEDVVGRDIVESYGGEVRLVKIMEGHSTTGLTEKLLRKK